MPVVDTSSVIDFGLRQNKIECRFFPANLMFATYPQGDSLVFAIALR